MYKALIAVVLGLSVAVIAQTPAPAPTGSKTESVTLTELETTKLTNIQLQMSNADANFALAKAALDKANESMRQLSAQYQGLQKDLDAMHKDIKTKYKVPDNATFASDNKTVTYSTPLPEPKKEEPKKEEPKK